MCELWWPCLVGPPGFHTTVQEPKRAHFRVPALQTPPKFNQKDQKRGKKRTNFAAGEGKKRAKFWAVRRRAVPGRAVPGRAVPGRAVPGRAVPGRAVPGAPNMNRKFGQNIKTPKLAKWGLAECGHENKLAKFGFFLAKCGFGQIRFGQMWS